MPPPLGRPRRVRHRARAGRRGESRRPAAGGGEHYSLPSRSHPARPGPIRPVRPRTDGHAPVRDRRLRRRNDARRLDRRRGLLLGPDGVRTRRGDRSHVDARTEAEGANRRTRRRRSLRGSRGLEPDPARHTGLPEGLAAGRVAGRLTFDVGWFDRYGDGVRRRERGSQGRGVLRTLTTMLDLAGSGGCPLPPEPALCKGGRAGGQGFGSPPHRANPHRPSGSDCRSGPFGSERRRTRRRGPGAGLVSVSLHDPGGKDEPGSRQRGQSPTVRFGPRWAGHGWCQRDRWPAKRLADVGPAAGERYHRAGPRGPRPVPHRWRARGRRPSGERSLRESTSPRSLRSMRSPAGSRRA